MSKNFNRKSIGNEREKLVKKKKKKRICYFFLATSATRERSFTHKPEPSDLGILDTSVSLLRLRAPPSARDDLCWFVSRASLFGRSVLLLILLFVVLLYCLN
jgi:hypothetical protein